MSELAQLLEFKCSSCAASLKFDVNAQQMKCPFCDTVIAVADAMAQAKAEEAAAQATLEAQQAQAQQTQSEVTADAPLEGGQTQWAEGETDGMLIYSCESCGGEIVAHATTGATRCPFCGNNVVMTQQFAGDLRPDYVIPFKLDKEAAKAALSRHLQGKRLLPKQFSTESHIDEIKGVYIPFWLFDTETSGDVTYRATKVRSWSDSNYRYVETQYYSLHRSGNVIFDNLPVDGSRNMDDTLMESLEPFDFSEAVDFQTAYLSGYLADRYDVTAQDCLPRARERASQSTLDAFAQTISGYNSVKVESSNIHLVRNRAKYALYPVWLLSTTWNGQKFTFAMNGQTGKFVGDLPMDKKRYWTWFGGIGGGIAAVLFLLSLLTNCIS